MSASSGPTSAVPRGTRRVALLVGALSLLLHLLLAHRLIGLGVFHEEDVLFDADPYIYITSFGTGRNVARWGGRSFAHPHVSNLLHPPIALLQRAAEALHQPPGPVRAALSCAVGPVAAGISAGVSVLALAHLGAPLWGVALLSLLSQAALSSVIFGALPESYPLSGLGYAWLFYLAARTARGRAPGRAESAAAQALPWGLCGLYLTGVTLTNVGAFGLVLAGVLVARPGRPLWVGLGQAAGAVAAVLALTAALYQVGASCYPDAPRFGPGGTGQSDELHPPSLRALVVEYPLALGRSFLGGPPVQRPRAVTQRHPFTLTYRGGARPGDAPRAWLMWTVLLLGLFGGRFMDRGGRAVVWSAGLVVAFHAALHSFYGTELFLYSQHWVLAVTVTSAGVLFLPERRWLGAAALSGLLALCAVSSGVTVYAIEQALSR